MSSDEHMAAARRLRIAFDLFEAGCEIMKQNLRRRHPDLSADVLHAKFVTWLQHRPGAMNGDAPGRRGVWPRSQ